MAYTGTILVKASQIPEIAALVEAARAVRDELRVRGDHGVSMDIEQRLRDALTDLGV